MTARCVGVSKPTLSICDVEIWEHTCPTCGKETKRQSIDGGLTSIFRGLCGHEWEVSPCVSGGKRAR